MKVNTDLNMQSVSRVTFLAAPSVGTDAATKAYVDDKISGLSWKDSCRAATIANITTVGNPGTAIFDGVTLVANDRILVRAQTSAQQNGIYVWNSSSSMTRAADADTFDKLEGAAVSIDTEPGSTVGGVTYIQTNVNGVIGTDVQTWSEFGTGISPASETLAGKAELATQAETDGLINDVTIVTPLKLANYVNKKLKYSALIGDGASTTLNINHALGTKQLIATFMIEATGEVVMEPDLTYTTTSNLQTVWATAPATNTIRVTIIG